MWVQMEANQHLRRKGRMKEWWSLIANAMNEKFNHGFTGHACADKASEVHKANRPYPWSPEFQAARQAAAPADVPQPTQETEIRDALFTLAERITRLEKAIVNALEERLSPTPDVKPAVNQVWVSRARRAETNNEHCHMCIVATENNEVTLREIGGSFTYTLPVRNLVRHFSHVGFAGPAFPNPVVTRPQTTVRPADPVDTLVAPVTVDQPVPTQPQTATPQPATNGGHRDLSSIIG